MRGGPAGTACAGVGAGVKSSVIFFVIFILPSLHDRTQAASYDGTDVEQQKNSQQNLNFVHRFSHAR
jgi:hypothetical protein